MSCKDNVKPNNNQNLNILIQNLQGNFIKWWGYYNYNIELSSSFIAINEYSITISKDQFLKLLKTGNYIPVQLNKNHSDSIKKYQLFKFPMLIKT